MIRAPNAPGARLKLPEGTVTFLFSDVEGSTQLLEAHPHEMGGALARHHEIFEEVIAGHDGVIFETVGDAVYGAFDRAADAAAAAIDVQLALEAEDWGTVGRIACRISLHTGDVERRGDHYFGPPLFRCARLQSLAYGEQTVLSERTAELLRDGLPPGAFLRDEGWHRLKDLTEREHVFTLLDPRLRQEFPPLKSVDLRPNNLPTQLSSFVGRANDIARLRELARQHRLVTLTGPGGIGKTRLALRVATEMLEDLPDGAFFVDLSDVSDPELVMPTVLSTLGLRESAEASPVEVVEGHLRGKSLLLLVDNFEQVISAAPTIAHLLGAAPQVHVLVTSRGPLHVRGEHEYHVEPLASDDRIDEEVDEASRLFIERALAVNPDQTVSAAERDLVREIVQRLDGLPLAIELAAARIRVLSLAAMLQQLEHRLPLLRGAHRDAPERHRALASAIRWSYDLLDAEDQRLFATLGVFAGGFDLAAAAVVSGIDETELLDPVERLVDASLLRAIPDSATPRFGMLETIREFALDRCLEAWPDAVDRHAALFGDVVAGIDDALRSSGQMERLHVLDVEKANIRAAMELLRTRDDPRLAADGGRALAVLADSWIAR
jgi:predicted ATPase/class 3 adenylate cyclase